MKNIFIIIVSLLSISACSQPATIQYVNNSIDSFSHTLDSTVVKSVKQTITNTSIVLDTLSVPNNTFSTFQLLVQTDTDNTIKILYVKNSNGTYSILVDSDIKTFSYNKTGGFFSSTIIYSISASVINNKVVLMANGQKNKIINWKLSKSTL